MARVLIDPQLELFADEDLPPSRPDQPVRTEAEIEAWMDELPF